MKEERDESKLDGTRMNVRVIPEPGLSSDIHERNWINRRKASTYPNVFTGLMVVGMKDGKEFYRVVLDTYLRKEHAGAYYWVHFYRSHELSNEGSEAYNEIMELMNHFHGEVYRFNVLGVVDPKLMSDRDGTVVFEKDEDTTSESVRLLRHQYPLRPDECYPRYKTDKEIAWERLTEDEKRRR